MTVEIIKGELIIREKVEPRLSSTGKMTLIASSGGFQPTTVLHEGKVVKVNLTAGVSNK